MNSVDTFLNNLYELGVNGVFYLIVFSVVFIFYLYFLLDYIIVQGYYFIYCLGYDGSLIRIMLSRGVLSVMMNRRGGNWLWGGEMVR